ncbi:kinase-like domain, phloem protein 2-like protein, partial [Tanacetum coccineum]
MIQPEIAESVEIAESAEITERTEDSRECRKFRNSINVTVINKTYMGDFQLFTNKVVSKNFVDKNIITKDSYQGQLLLSGELINILALRLNKEVDDKDTQEFWMEVSLLSSVMHKNLVSLVGFCDENDVKLKVEWSLSIDQSRQGYGDEYDTKKTEVTSKALIGFGLFIYYHIESLLESLIA